MKTPDTPTPTAAAVDPNVPIGTPPGGGRWTWDAPAQAWAPVTDAIDATDNHTQQE